MNEGIKNKKPRLYVFGNRNEFIFVRVRRGKERERQVHHLILLKSNKENKTDFTGMTRKNKIHFSLCEEEKGYKEWEERKERRNGESNQNL